MREFVAAFFDDIDKAVHERFFFFFHGITSYNDLITLIIRDIELFV